MKLPPLEYCSVERATRLLGCEVSDLIHWHEIGAIRLYVNIIDEVDAQLVYMGDANKNTIDTKETSFIGELLEKNYWENKHSNIFVDGGPYVRRVYIEDMIAWYFDVKITGLWSCLEWSNYGQILDKIPYDDENHIFLLSYDYKVSVSLHSSFSTPIKINPNELIIMWDDIEKIQNVDQWSLDTEKVRENILIKETINKDIIPNSERIQKAERILNQIYMKEHFSKLWENENSTTLANELNYLAEKYGFDSQTFQESTIAGWMKKYKP
ncbi:hypothetical protein A9G13_07520 [Gilliamella sp. wkB178]|uniref:hypothetical protein n=1 Tax=Gilliamella sp. wkB178 TaxID=3120259 RepID=UPI00080E9D7F|nr:hypothetical protein [Gilliamella apicola]OCG08037.1 hypothetical protein A9G13_07520 [Gilliamella apicola]